MKKISVSHGRKFIKKDYNSKICTGTKNKPISIILGSKIAREYGLKPGRILHDGEIEKYYKVVGILKEKSKWFMQSVSDGMITLVKPFRHKTLEERAERYGGKLNLNGEYDWGERVGREGWE